MIRYCGSGMIRPQASPIAAPSKRVARLQSLAAPHLFPVEYFPGIRRVAISTSVACKRVASARSFDGGLFDVASQRSTSGTWKRVTLVLTTAQLALRRRKAG